jgi:hypothetical protein
MVLQKVKLFLSVLFLVSLFSGIGDVTNAAPKSFSSIPPDPSLNPYDGVGRQ